MSVTVLVEYQRQTERALLVHYNNEPHWLPKSQIESNGRETWGDTVRGDEIRLVLSDWIARQKNITSNTAADDSPINEDKYTVDIALAEHAPFNINFRVCCEGDVICYATTERSANMIAAAMALTEGKV